MTKVKVNCIIITKIVSLLRWIVFSKGLKWRKDYYLCMIKCLLRKMVEKKREWRIMAHWQVVGEDNLKMGYD